MAPKLNRAERRQQAKLERHGQSSRLFSYSMGEAGKVGHVNLNFTLRTDIKEELKNFLECMKVAMVEVEEEIAKKN